MAIIPLAAATIQRSNKVTPTLHHFACRLSGNIWTSTLIIKHKNPYSSNNDLPKQVYQSLNPSTFSQTQKKQRNKLTDTSSVSSLPQMQMISHKAANKNSTSKHIKSIFKLSKNRSARAEPKQNIKKKNRDQTLAHFAADPQGNEKFYKKQKEKDQSMWIKRRRETDHA